jgi:hypothetical protein
MRIASLFRPFTDLYKEFDRRMTVIGQNPVLNGVGTGATVFVVGVVYLLYFHISVTVSSAFAIAILAAFVGAICGVLQFLGRESFKKPAPQLVETAVELGFGWLAFMIALGCSTPESVWLHAMAAIPIAVTIAKYVVAPAIWALGRWLIRITFRR